MYYLNAHLRIEEREREIISPIPLDLSFDSLLASEGFAFAIDRELLLGMGAGPGYARNVSVSAAACGPWTSCSGITD